MRVLAILVLTLWTGIAAAQNFPNYRATTVNDFADVLSDTDELQIAATLQDLRAETGIEFTVVTITDMARYLHPGPIEAFATGLFNTWGVGDAQRNDGVMLLVAVEDRRVRIEVGSGYGRSMNDPMEQVINRDITPAFRAGDYPKGIRAGVDGAIAALTFDPEQAAADRRSRVIKIVAWVAGGLALLLGPFAAFPIIRAIARRRPRYCPNDGAKMHRVTEAADDKYLQAGQQIEESIGSVDYDVWICTTCAHETIEAFPKKLRRFGACKECGFRTLESDTVTMRRSTSTTQGMSRTTYKCMNCGTDYAVDRLLPLVMRSSSSSSSGSSGSSGFSGGSSSGGGASGSW